MTVIDILRKVDDITYITQDLKAVSSHQLTDKDTHTLEEAARLLEMYKNELLLREVKE